jgi:hypothetical protein
MLARLDHRPMLTAVLALSTAVLIVVVITLATLVFTSAPPASPTSNSGGSNPGAAAAPSENYGYDVLHQRDTWEAVRKERMERLEK